MPVAPSGPATVTGNRIWQQVGPDTVRRVYFDYYSNSKLLAAIRTPESTKPDSIYYDTLGNVRRTRTPLGYVELIYRGAIGRDTLVYSPVDTTHTSDATLLASGAWVRTTYDLADRPLVVTQWGPGVTTGSPVPSRTVPPDSVKLTHTYDALGRLTRRIVPQASYDSLNCMNYGYCPGFSFPTIDVDGKPGLCIPADTAYFEYDAAGRLTRADNMYAQVRRTYKPNGLFDKEELRIRTYYRSGKLNDCGEEAPEPMSAVPTLEADFDKHVYVTERTYDLDGRRLTLTHPLGGGTQHYYYNASPGVLDSIKDPLGNKVRFHYDKELRHTGTTYQTAVGDLGEWVSYDDDGRVDTLSAPHGVGATLVRDARGRVVSGTINSVVGGSYQVKLWYHGLGALVASSGLTGQSPFEEMDVDALGNRVLHRVNGAFSGHTDRWRRMTYNAWGQLEAVWVGANDPKPYPSYDYRMDYLYDQSGNLHRAYGYETKPGRVDDESVSYYGADEKLRVYNRHVGLGTSLPGGVYEEYRYDALGRRVLVRSIATSSCTSQACDSYIERTAWDGDQVLMEIRAPGKHGVIHSDLENENAVGLAADGYPFGRVRYVHAGEMDLPLVIIRENMQNQPQQVAVAPHANWQGDFEVGTILRSSDPSTTSLIGTPTTMCSGQYGCPLITWPGNQTTADGERTFTTWPSWFGSLARQKEDGSGLQYMRNRYYDPKTGRFTQQDPIGLAGGLN